MMIKYFKNLEKEPLDDIGATMAYESEKSRLDKKLEKQRETDLFSDLRYTEAMGNRGFVIYYRRKWLDKWETFK